MEGPSSFCPRSAMTLLPARFAASLVMIMSTFFWARTPPLLIVMSPYLSHSYLYVFLFALALLPSFSSALAPPFLLLVVELSIVAAHMIFS